MTFNRLVLEQVAKDGTTYKSLAKEMAKALLETGQAAQPTSFECYLTLRDEGENLDPDVLEASQCEGLPVIAYRPGYTRGGMRVYFVEIIPPQEQP